MTDDERKRRIDEGFKKLTAALDELEEQSGEDRRNLSPMHIRRPGKTEYVLVMQSYYELLEAKAYGWDRQNQDDSDDQSESEAAVLADFRKALGPIIG